MTTFVPRADFATTLEQAHHDLQSYKNVRGYQPQPNWNDWAGEELLDLMRRYRDETAKLFHSPKTTLRLAATSLAAEYWQGAQQFTGELLQLAFDDPDSAVRGAALMALGFHKQYIADPTQFLEKLLQELFPSRSALLEYARNLAVRCNADMRRMLEVLGGKHIPHMLESRAGAESYLEHTDPHLRAAAIFALKDHWKPDERFIKICERMAFQDIDLKVRKLALSTLACCFSGTDDLRVGKLVASMVYDDSIEEAIRLTAYRSLFTIRGMGLDAFTNAHSHSFCFPADVDWAFVDSFLKDR